MAITALALLRIAPPATPIQGARITRLDDAILLHTQADFGSDPAQLSQVVRKQLGDAAVDAHTDPRGIFFIPSVASPATRTYDAVIAEVGEGGEWGPARVAANALGAAALGGGLGALLGSLLEQMPSGVLDSVSAAARGQPGAFEAASSQLRAAVEGEDSKLDVASLGAMLENAGIDLNSMQALMGQVESALASDPERAAALAEQLFGEGADLDEDEDDLDDEDEDDLDEEGDEEGDEDEAEQDEKDV
jgi:hypothetical protein